MTLEDANDQPPFFTRTIYDSTVFESAPPGTSALQVIALDRDSGRNGEIVYSIDAGKHGLEFITLPENISIVQLF